MSPSPSRFSPPDPVRLHLVEVRRGLLRLHKALVDSERAEYERENGQLTNGQFLQLLLNDAFFAWLRPYSGLIAEMDEALAAAEPVTGDQSGALIGRVLGLIAQSEAGDSRYDGVRHRDPGVLFAHVELSRRISAEP